MAHRQLHQTFSFYVFAMLMLLTLLPPGHVASLACNACGPECANACGTAMFRACCFNYNKKRSLPIEEYDSSVSDIPANLSEGTDGTSKNTDLAFGKVRPLFKRFLTDKWLRLSGKLPEEMQERGRQKYQIGSYYFE